MNDRWQLGGYVIEKWGKADRPPYLWVTFIWEAPSPLDEVQFVPFVGKFIGPAWLEHDVLVLGSWKVHDEAKDYKSQDNAIDYVKSLPLWDESKYWMKFADIGESGLIDCRTNAEVVDTLILDDIMPKLGFKKAPTFIDDLDALDSFEEDNIIPF